MKRGIIFSLFACLVLNSIAANSPRERLLMDADWKFAYGHPYDASKDFNHGIAYFSYLAKAGYADGAAAPNFDDRDWRVLDLPHDFAVEQPFSGNGSHSHGYKAIGRNFPDVSVGWYRKTFHIPAEDLGRRIGITFDGVSRDAKVWINGHFLGNESSGYNSFSYDLTAYLNYSGSNTIAVRTDVTHEEGWYYEGAGIYRHVWLTKTSPVHVITNGTFVYSEIETEKATLNIETEIENESFKEAAIEIRQQLIDATGSIIAESEAYTTKLPAKNKTDVKQHIEVENPHLWSIDDPYLYQIQTIVYTTTDTSDIYLMTTGIRSIHFDPDKGFFLNGEHVKLKGTNNHQDHAGVGTAIPDELQYFRISKLKEMGSNAYRCSHNPPTPELLEACDRLGMVVIDENRLMGTAPFVNDNIERLIRRDRNHPSIVLWSLGNEEWAIEGNIIGERIIQEMQIFANQLDPTRLTNAASSGSWGQGVSKHIEVMGFNYLKHGNTDEYHQKFPETFCVGTEEGSTNTTRGIYFDDPEKHYLAAYDRPTPNGYFYSIEHCWKHYNSRNYLAGIFIWTGFDYRGEPTPFGWPSIHSYFGMYDDCGFPKDNVWYLKSWWGNEPVLHLLPHWNWADKEGDTVLVVAYSNCDEVELFLNGESQGRKTMKKDSHLEWSVSYSPGELKAIGYKNGEKLLIEKVETTGDPIALKLEAQKQQFKANGEDLAIITVSTTDKKGRIVPTANNLINFEIEGPAKIIGVGNGDPTCLEPDKYIDQITAVKIKNLKAKVVDDLENRSEAAIDFDDTEWKSPWEMRSEIQNSKATIYSGEFEMPEAISEAQINFFYNCIGDLQTIYINGVAISGELDKDKNERYTFKLDTGKLYSGKNKITIFATPYTVKHSWDTPNTDPGAIQVIIPAQSYKRSLFNGYAQVIVQMEKDPGTVKLTAKSEGLEAVDLIIKTQPAVRRAAVE